MSEKYLGENSTPILINQIKEKCTLKVSTLPTASADELGKIYQYIGTTSGSIVHNYFYECVSDGAVIPTYSWQNVSVQPTATPTASGTTFDNTTSGLQATNVQGAIDEVENRVDTAESDIDGIEGKIPSTATTTNKLVDHDSLGTAAFKDSTDRVSPNNTALVESQSVYSAINTALSSIYTPRGDITCAELTSDLLIAANVGNIYETSDSGTTTALFLQGAGVPIPTGSNVGIISAGQGRILFNLMANAFDLTDYQKKDLANTIEGATTVEGALGALSTNKATQAEVNDIVNILGAKNILNNEVTTSSDWHGVSRTVNADGTITLNGTSTAWDFANFNYVQGQKSIPSGTYIINGGCENTALAIVADGSVIARQYGAGETTFTITDNMVETYARFEMSTDKTFTSESSIIKPMIRLASDPDDTYVPYSRTNQELTAKTDGLWDNTMNNGAVNLLENDGTTTTVNGITFTVSSDGTVTVSGTATANVALPLKMRPYLGNSFPLKLSGCPVGGSFASGYRLQYANYVDMTDLVSDEGNGAIITKQIDYTTYPNARVSIEVRSGTQISSPIVFKPMISDASLNLSYNDYLPYAKTNKELTDIIPSDASILNKLVTESDLNGTLLSASNTFTPSSGYEILDWSVYQLGNHVWGTFILHKTSGDIPAGQTEVGNFSSTLRNAVNSVCFCSNNRYGGGAFYTGYLFIDQTGKMLMGNPSGTTTGINHAKISIDFCLA